MYTDAVNAKRGGRPHWRQPGLAHHRAVVEVRQPQPARAIGQPQPDRAVGRAAGEPVVCDGRDYTDAITRACPSIARDGAVANVRVRQEFLAGARLHVSIVQLIPLEKI